MINPPRRVTHNSGNGLGRPGTDTHKRMVTGLPVIKPGLRVKLRGIPVKGAKKASATTITGYVAHIRGPLAKIDTWGAIPPVWVRIDRLTY